MAMTSCRQFPTHGSCSCLGPPALMLHASGHRSGKKHLDRREMNEDGYAKLKKNKGGCGKSRKSRRREIFSVPGRSRHVVSQR